MVVSILEESIVNEASERVSKRVDEVHRCLKKQNQSFFIAIVPTHSQLCWRPAFMTKKMI
jgi:hypothetical protein